MPKTTFSRLRVQGVSWCEITEKGLLERLSNYGIYKKSKDKLTKDPWSSWRLLVVHGPDTVQTKLNGKKLLSFL